MNKTVLRCIGANAGDRLLHGGRARGGVNATVGNRRRSRRAARPLRGVRAERGKHPRDVSRPDVNRYRNWLGEHVNANSEGTAGSHPRYAPATIARKLAAIRSFYDYLSQRGVVPGSPAASVKSPAVSPIARGRPITELQVRELISTAAAHGSEAEAIVRLLVLNGLRVSEVCGAEIADIRREPGGGRSLMICGKNGKYEAVALNARTERAVLAAVGARTEGPIFRRQDGRRLRASADAPWAAYNRHAVYRLLTELAHTSHVGQDCRSPSSPATNIEEPSMDGVSFAR